MIDQFLVLDLKGIKMSWCHVDRGGPTKIGTQLMAVGDGPPRV